MVDRILNLPMRPLAPVSPIAPFAPRIPDSPFCQYRLSLPEGPEIPVAPTWDQIYTFQIVTRGTFDKFS